MDFRLDGKVAIVTGGTSGIGEGICRAYGENGAKVVIAGRNAERGDKIAADINAAGGEATFIKTDVTIEEDIIALVDKTIKKYGKLDIMVNNAGINISGEILGFSSEMWDKVMSSNTKAVFLGIKYSMPHLIKTKGSLITVSSMASVMPRRLHSAYSASKAAATALTKVAALEFASHGVRCNIICPGAVDTPILSGTPREVVNKSVASIPLGRIGQPEDIAGLAVYLGADISNWVTGNCIVPDGGMTLL